MEKDVVCIRKAGIQDAADICSFGERTYTEHFSFLWTKEGLHTYIENNFNSRSIQKELEENKAEYYFLTRNSNLAGFAKLVPSSINPIDGSRGVELKKIYFLKEAAGQGLGQKLLDYCLQVSKKYNQYMWLDVLKINKAIRFYERNGFSIIGEKSYSIEGKDIGLYIMRKHQ